MSSERHYGCVFCRSGQEYEVVNHMTQVSRDLKAVVPSKLRYRRSHGIATEERIVLFPGYVFFESSPELDIREVLLHKDVFRVLTDANGDWKLQGLDENVARQFVSTEGLVGFSKAFYDGDRIRIIEGFLKQFEGKIVRVNRRANTAQILIRIDNKQFSLWAGFEIIENMM